MNLTNEFNSKIKKPIEPFRWYELWYIFWTVVGLSFLFGR